MRLKGDGSARKPLKRSGYPGDRHGSDALWSVPSTGAQ
jgi:hypothetical protein